MKVLIVDDNKRTADGLLKYIPWSKTGCSPLGATYNGEQALDFARLYLPDIVITDVRMPLMDGLTLCKTLYQEMPDVQTIIISAYDEFEYAKSAMAFGTKHYILKPLHKDKINDIAEILLGMSDAAQKKTKAMSRTLDIQIERELFELIKDGSTGELKALLQETLESTDYKTLPLIATSYMRSLYLFLEQINLPLYLLGDSLEVNIQYINEIKSPQYVIQHVLQSYDSIARYISERKAYNADYIVDAIKLYIDNHFADQTISTSSLAEKFNISVSYLCSIFKTSIHQNITSYILDLRMEEAVNLLQNTNRSIQDITTEVGYQNANYFSKVFRRHRGISPSDFRNINNG